MHSEYPKADIEQPNCFRTFFAFCCTGQVTKPFLEKYQDILAEEGIVHLKTDSEFLHGYLLGILHEGNHEILHANHDIYNSSSPPEEATAIQTFYENQYLEVKKAITYIRFRTQY